MKQFSLLPVVSEVHGQAMALSVDVAAYFGKNHRDVLRVIDRILERCTPDQARNFAQLILTVSVGKGASKPIRAYHMTRDGFSFLVMGFTGPQADQWKWSYIAAFNAMARELAERRAVDALAAERPEALIRVNGPRAALADQAILLHEEGLNKAQVAALMGLSSRYVVYRLFRRYAAALRGKRREILV